MFWGEPPGEEIAITGRENFAVNPNNELSRECRSSEEQEMEVYSTLGITAHKPTLRFHQGIEYEGIIVKSSEMEIECEAEHGYVFVRWNPGGEKLTLGANGQASLKPMSVRVEYEIFHEGSIEELVCYYSKRALSGTNTATATRQPLAVELGGALDSHGAPKRCGRTIHVSLSLPRIEADQGTVEEEI